MTRKVLLTSLFFAALAALSLGVATGPAFAASTIAGDRAAIGMQQIGAYGCA
jgi:hypothetical protein